MKKKKMQVADLLRKNHSLSRGYMPLCWGEVNDFLSFLIARKKKVPRGTFPRLFIMFGPQKRLKDAEIVYPMQIYRDGGVSIIVKVKNVHQGSFFFPWDWMRRKEPPLFNNVRVKEAHFGNRS